MKGKLLELVHSFYNNAEDNKQYYIPYRFLHYLMYNEWYQPRNGGEDTLSNSGIKEEFEKFSSSVISENYCDGMNNIKYVVVNKDDESETYVFDFLHDSQGDTMFMTNAIEDSVYAVKPIEVIRTEYVRE